MYLLYKGRFTLNGTCFWITSKYKMGNNPSAEKQRKELFLRIADKLKATDPNLVRSIGGIYLFCVMRDQTVKYWTVDADKIDIYEGDPKGDVEPDATFTLNEETLIKIAKAEITARVAVQSGKCSVTGNIMQAMKLEPYIKL